MLPPSLPIHLPFQTERRAVFLIFGLSVLNAHLPQAWHCVETCWIERHSVWTEAHLQPVSRNVSIQPGSWNSDEMLMGLFPNSYPWYAALTTDLDKRRVWVLSIHKLKYKNRMNPLFQELRGMHSDGVYAVMEVKPLHRGGDQWIQVFVCFSLCSPSPSQSSLHR